MKTQQDIAMIKWHRYVIERFPDQIENFREMVGTNAAFDALCTEFGEVSESLERLHNESSGTSKEEQARLKNRQTELEHKLLESMSVHIRT